MASSSAVIPDRPRLQPTFDPDGASEETEQVQALIAKLQLQPHIEGGYFVETDRDTARVPNPFLAAGRHASATGALNKQQEATRSASTSIFYLLTPHTSLGAFHRNRGRTVHTLHRGRGRYVIIHADEVADASCPGGYDGDQGERSEQQRWSGKARVETFIVGPDVLRDERLQWIVDGGKYKCSFLLPDVEGGTTSEGLLISETVVPGFEYADHDFMREERMAALVTEEQAQEMRWMLRKV